MKSGIRIIRHMLPDPPPRATPIPEKRTYLLPSWVKLVEVTEDPWMDLWTKLAELDFARPDRQRRNGVLTGITA